MSAVDFPTSERILRVCPMHGPTDTGGIPEEMRGENDTVLDVVVSFVFYNTPLSSQIILILHALRFVIVA